MNKYLVFTGNEFGFEISENQKLKTLDECEKIHKRNLKENFGSIIVKIDKGKFHNY